MTHLLRTFTHLKSDFLAPLIAVALSTSLLIPQALAEESGIRVSAIGTAFVKPELAKVHLSFEHTAETADIARDFTSKQVSTLLKSLKDFDIEQDSLDSSQINISPSYNYHDNKRTLEGYQVTRFVNFSLNNLEQLETMVAAITAAGASRVNSIQFDVKNATEAHAIALEDAIEKTKAAASAIAKSYGAELGKVQFVEHAIEHNGAPKPAPMRAMALESNSDAPSDTYQIQNIEFRARVSSTFELD